MVIRKLASLAVIAALGLLAGSTSASAHTALRTDPGNLPLSGSTTITNTTSDHWTLSTQAGTVTCQQASFDIDAHTHTGNPSIAGTLTELTFQSCTDTILSVNILSCHLHLSTLPTVTITSGPGGGTVVFGHLILRCVTTTPGRACYYTSLTAAGSYNNATSSLHFANVAATAVTATTDAIPPLNCGNNGTWGVTFTHVVQGGTNRTITITAN
jgi:hypothetical protein